LTWLLLDREISVEQNDRLQKHLKICPGCHRKFGEIVKLKMEIKNMQLPQIAHFPVFKDETIAEKIDLQKKRIKIILIALLIAAIVVVIIWMSIFVL
jgi:hypothetical protein